MEITKGLLLGKTYKKLIHVLCYCLSIFAVESIALNTGLLSQQTNQR